MRTIEQDRQALAEVLTLLTTHDAQESAHAAAAVLTSSPHDDQINQLFCAVSRLTGLPSCLGAIDASIATVIAVARQRGLDIPGYLVPFTNN